MANWFAVYSQSQKEQLAARSLKERGYEVFWPHTTHWVGTGHKAKSRLLRRSWLSRYLFVRTDKENLWSVNDAMGVSTVVFAPGGEPYPIPEKVMDKLTNLADQSGEIYTGKLPRPKPKYRVGDVIRITDEKSPLFGLYAEVKKVLDSGLVHAMFRGTLAGGGKIILPESTLGEVVEGAA